MSSRFLSRLLHENLILETLWSYSWSVVCNARNIQLVSVSLLNNFYIVTDEKNRCTDEDMSAFKVLISFLSSKLS